MMRRYLPLLTLLLTACGSDEESAAKDRAASQASWALVLKVDGADVRLPLKIMNVLLFKDEAYAKQNPSTFHIEGEGVALIGEIAAADNVDYDEHWNRLIGKTLTIKASGEFHRDPVESALTLPGKTELKITGGTLIPQSVKGKWAGSEGNKTLSGKIRLQLQDGRTLEGTFSVHAVTWG